MLPSIFASCTMASFLWLMNYDETVDSPDGLVHGFRGPGELSLYYAIINRS
jgi:hypothetical protein